MRGAFQLASGVAERHPPHPNGWKIDTYRNSRRRLTLAECGHLSRSGRRVLSDEA